MVHWVRSTWPGRLTMVDAGISLTCSMTGEILLRGPCHGVLHPELLRIGTESRVRLTQPVGVGRQHRLHLLVALDEPRRCGACSRLTIWAPGRKVGMTLLP